MGIVAVGVGVGVAPVPVGVGVGVGVGVAAAPAALAGVVSRFCTDEAVKTTFWFPPKNAPINGVRSRKWPLTVTLTVFPMPLSQVTGLHVTVTSDGLIVTPPLDSSLIRQ